MEQLFDKLMKRMHELKDAQDYPVTHEVNIEAKARAIDALNDYIDKRIQFALHEHKIVHH